MESIHAKEKVTRAGHAKRAMDGFLANLPIFICGLIIALTIVHEMF